MKTILKSIIISTLILSFNFSYAQTFYGVGAGTNGGNTVSNFGYTAGQLSVGNNNTFIGGKAGRWCYTANFNTFVGSRAGIYSNGESNTYLGAFAGENNRTGNRNVFVGTGAGRNSQSGTNNVYIGLSAGAENEKGNDNTFMGDLAGMSSDGSNNVFIGKMAGWTTSGSNQFIVSSTQNDLITGDFLTKEVHFYGNVGIGVTDPQNKLEVCGVVRAEEVRVAEGWCDYVFDDNFDLPTLVKEEAFIKENGHLLSFESAAEMNGEIQLGDVTKRQQETIEKLMLYTIELSKEIKALKEEVNNLK